MLHHYTSVATLALILRHKTLRFTRLDRFDDATEGRSIGTYPAGTRMFASCWSATSGESIPQWAMYGDAMKGVRVSLPRDPFVWHHHNFEWHEKFKVVALDAPFSLEEMLDSGVMLCPTPEMKETFGRPVRYVRDVATAISGLYKEDEDSLTFFGDGNEIAFFKSDVWSFQEEFRYVLRVEPGPPTPFKGDVASYLEARRKWGQSGVNLLTATPDRTHIDLQLDAQALTAAEITIGPLAPHGTLEIVEALISRFAPGATARQSTLSGTIRPT